MGIFDLKSQLCGRRKITTNIKITGNPEVDIDRVKAILNECLPLHNQNVRKENELFGIAFNDKNWWRKEKRQRSDINNKISIPAPWADSRAINSYCFAEPIKYIARDTSESSNKQTYIERLSAMLDYAHNHDSTIMATLSSSICGLGYKLALPATQDEYDMTGVPFVINSNFIYPQKAFVVVSDEIIQKDVLGVVIGTYYNEKNEPEGNKYTCWTKYHQFVLRDNPRNSAFPYELVEQIGADGLSYKYYKLTSGYIPLIEVERNPFRKGDWEQAIDLYEMKNKLMSNRADDIQQVVDYILVLVNCLFENEDDRKNVLNNRYMQLNVTDPANKPDVKILQNPLDQNAIQACADYIDSLIAECVGVPNRQENGYGGGDTGEAVKFRNGFRDLENNAGIIVPKMDAAELKFLAVCINYCVTMQDNEIGDLRPRDIRCKFPRTLTDDAYTASIAFGNYVEKGMSFVDALILSRSGTDPSEIAENAKKAYENGETYLQLKAKAENMYKATETIITETANSDKQITETNPE